MSGENDFLSRITEVIEDNMSSEQFGVSELAAEIGMSRSNLLRKINKLTGLSASRFIRKIRLKKAMELLKEGSVNVSEVSWSVGFNSTSYFIKCFHEEFGYPPGEVGKRDLTDETNQVETAVSSTRNYQFVLTIAIVVILGVGAYFAASYFFPGKTSSKKSIAVLPFKNDSNDTTNIYLINGLMESVLLNLQQIEDVRVISRTSVEKFRNKPANASEIAHELNVRYFVEGSGQKIDNQILLNIQLIDAEKDSHLWANQYIRETRDIFELQREIAKDIAYHIQAIITPEEEDRIDKVPTNDLVAYDYFLQGLDLFYRGERESLFEAISFFEKAIDRDPEFARAYADIAISYYFLDVYQREKKYADSISNYSDKALFFDSKLAQSLVAKALFYMHSGENELAVPYLEKALEYNPNSAMVINILSDFYVSTIPNTAKYLEYALRGVQLDIASHDSVLTSYIYLHLSNAFIQSGFVEEAEKYINKSLSYDQGNLYSLYVKAYIQYAKDRNLLLLNERLIEALSQDTTRVDILQEVGKSFYYLRDYPDSYDYYDRFMKIREAAKMDIYRGEDAKIGFVMAEMGMDDESEKMFDTFKNYAFADESIYKHLSLSAYYSYLDESEKAIEHLKLFAQSDNYHYWIILFVPIDPLFDNIKDHPEFFRVWSEIETKFWESHDQIKATLGEKELL